MEYLVNIDINGESVLVGSITGDNNETARFQYSETYLNNTDSKPISISLPLQENAFTAQQTKIFFDGLLPEGYTRRAGG